MPKGAGVWVSLVIAFAVYTLEDVRVWMWEYGSLCFVLRHGELVLKLALQHHLKWQWYSDLCGPLHLMHLDSWKWHENVVYPHFQQFLHWGIPRFILALLTVTMKRPMLKLQLMIFLADEPFCESHMLIHIITMSYFGETLHMWGLKAILTSLKMWKALIMSSITLESMGVLVFSMK